jgi:magnesium transporter
MASSSRQGKATAGPSSANERPSIADQAVQSTSTALPTVQSEAAATTTKKRRNHRGGKKKRARKQSFIGGGDRTGTLDGSGHDLLDPPASRPPFFGLGQSRTLSETSLDSEALLDHRDHPPMRVRRDSRPVNVQRGTGVGYDISASYRSQYQNPFVSNESSTAKRSRQSRAQKSADELEEEDDDSPGAMVADSRTPLLASTRNDDRTTGAAASYGMLGSPGKGGRTRGKSASTSVSSRGRRRRPSREQSTSNMAQVPEYDVNNPPSMPGSPALGAEMGYDDILATETFVPKSPSDRRNTVPVLGEHLIDIDGNDKKELGSTPPTPRRNSTDQRRRTIQAGAEEDVCFPVEGMSEMADDDYQHDQNGEFPRGTRRRRTREWPDLSTLEEWSREEKEVRSEGIRVMKVNEPVLVGGRLRPRVAAWHRTEEDSPYRFTYFNEEFQSTIHSQTISELVQEGQSFRELFIPDPPELSDYSSDEDDAISQQGTMTGTATARGELSPGGHSHYGTRHSSILGEPPKPKPKESSSGEATPAFPPTTAATHNGQFTERPKRYGARPTFWLDVLSPTDAEMRVISKTFGIHPLTAEDIMMQEAREKVELFRNYYFVNYRTFEQNINSEDYLEPVNMYVVVFRDGVISFHFSQTPHPANVRRRIRQLKDYLILSSDWISYAIIDDITDVFAPLIQTIEDEVDEIDDAILQLHSGGEGPKQSSSTKDAEKISISSQSTAPESSGGDMLRRIGHGRKKVMGLYRLLGNKADVIKGFAKRCNEQWDIAPRSEIGLYLGDIQDHILTMTSNLSHYETCVTFPPH